MREVHKRHNTSTYNINITKRVGDCGRENGWHRIGDEGVQLAEAENCYFEEKWHKNSITYTFLCSQLKNIINIIESVYVNPYLALLCPFSDAVIVLNGVYTQKFQLSHNFFYE